jgi:hypothetical protein
MVYMLRYVFVFIFSYTQFIYSIVIKNQNWKIKDQVEKKDPFE